MKNNKTVFFLRTSPYDYLIPGKNLYNSFNSVAKEEVETSLRRDAKKHFKKQVPNCLFKIKSVYCSPRKRSIQTAHFLSTDFKILSELIEVKFDMENFISKKDFYDKKGNPNINKARKRFVNALINNKLAESYEQIIDRIDKLFEIIETDQSKQIVIFSHGFFMKVIESYIRDKNVKKHPTKLLKYFDGCIETFKFCEGFVIELDNSEYIFNSYIRHQGD